MLSILKLQEQCKCDICHFTMRNCLLLSECGHRFCPDCITPVIAEKPQCPTCQTPANPENLVKDPRLNHILRYTEMMGQALLDHTLTPLEVSLQRREEEPSSSEDQPMSMESQDADNIKQPDRKKNAHDESESNQEPTRKKLKTIDAAEKQKLTDPSALFDSMMPTFDSQFFKSQSSQNGNTVEQNDTASSNDNPTLPVVNETTKEPSVDTVPEVGDDLEETTHVEPVGQSSDKPKENTDAIFEEESNTEKSIDEPVESTDLETPTISKQADLQEDATIFSSQDTAEKWECPQCKFANPKFLQTCSICHTYRNTDLNVSKPPPRQKKTKDNTPENKQDYELTVSGDNNTMENMTVPEVSTRAREMKAQKEAHILYTGLTPEDEKKLEKIKNEAAQSNLKIVIHYQTRDFDEITHIITSVNKKKLCKRTLKYLQGILGGKWIVEPEWLIKSVKSKEWQPEEKYEVQGDQQSGVTHAPLKSRENQSEQLFGDMKFYFFGDFTGKHNKNDLLILCRAGGGKLLNRKPAGMKNHKETIDRSEPVVIMNKEAKKKPAWLKECQVRDPSWIIDCIGTLIIK